MDAKILAILFAVVIMIIGVFFIVYGIFNWFSWDWESGQAIPLFGLGVGCLIVGGAIATIKRRD
jgi:hypothetical protein